MKKLLLFLIATAIGCNRSSGPSGPPLFEAVSAAASGVTFANMVREDSAVNIVNYLYFYNGGGVAAGDIDGDGLVDLYFTSNLGANHLYRNLGHFRFEDITARAGVADSVGWKSGVTMADVNGDGKLDIYVSGVNYLGMPGGGRNVLYINNGDGTFTDRTAEYGLDFSGYSTQAAFFDYDGDGDLDMYLLNSSTFAERAAARGADRTVRNAKAGDRLYRNDRGHFVDVSAAAHIYGGVEGFGLGVVASDFNLDGCPDLYIANDFPENDFLYLNNCDGTFTESIAQATGHTSRFSMGVDAADFDNDGRPDIAVLDMLPDSERIRKTAQTAESYELFERYHSAGYHYQYARNTLQLNRGVVGKLRFSDIGLLAGIAATDWSWAPLFADFDNDGRKDLFVSSGIYRRPNDLDYIASLDSIPGGTVPPAAQLIANMPHVPSHNYLFHNNGDLTFTDRAKDWGLGASGFSNGAAYVDLDNDGALDLVVNNLNAPAAIYRNRARDSDSTSHHFLTITLRGSGGNTAGIGAKVMVTSGGTHQLAEVMPTRGFESSVDPRPHFGLGTARRADSVVVVWPDRRFQVLTNVAADQFLTVSQSDALGRYTGPHAATPMLKDISDQLALSYRHRENAFFDFSREPLLPHMISTEGPALAVGDVNGDGRDDIYIGGAKWQPGELWLQQPDGRFRPIREPAFVADSIHEAVDAAFFDADGDGDLDLYVVSGGNEFWEGEPLRDRLYLNDGHGNFTRAPDALPLFYHNGSCVAVGGKFLFVGSRVVARQYGVPPRSYLLENDGRGHFRDVTQEKAPALDSLGLVTRATWVDYDGDGKLDLIVVGEWMSVHVFHQEDGHFVDRTDKAGLAGTNGWWTSIEAADLNGDGRPDLVLGNYGLNSIVRASRQEPARLYVGDLFGTGRPTQVLTSYRQGKSYPLMGRDQFLQVSPELRRRFPNYRSFGASRIEDIVPRAALKQARVLETDTLASMIALNRGDGTFELRALPQQAQFAPIYGSLAADFDGDGHVDLIVAGNFSGTTPIEGRYDASYGLLLRGDGKGGFAAVDMDTSGIAIDGQVRHLAVMTSAKYGRMIVVAKNNDSMNFLH